jgi:tetratricopeptide (TPR) repeat protein
MRFDLMRKLRTLLTAVALMLAVGVVGQTVNEAGEIYNEAVQNIKAKKYDAAITSLEDCIETCELVGMDADDLKAQAEKQLPNMYFKSAASLYKKKKYSDAIEMFKKTITVSEKYNNPDLAKKSKKYIPALYNGLAGAEIKAGNVDKANEYITSALEYNPKFAKAFLSKAQLAKTQGDNEALKASVAKVAEFDKKGKTKAKANKLAQSYFITTGAKQIQASNPAKAISLIKESFAYGDQNPDAYYYLAVAYNANKDYTNALDNANKAIQFETESKRSKIYYEIANAYLGMENKEKACENYKLVTSGANAAAAKKQLETLKCN